MATSPAARGALPSTNWNEIGLVAPPSRLRTENVGAPRPFTGTSSRSTTPIDAATCPPYGVSDLRLEGGARVGIRQWHHAQIPRDTGPFGVRERVVQAAGDRECTNDTEHADHCPDERGQHWDAVAATATVEGHRGAEPDRQWRSTAHAGGEQRGSVVGTRGSRGAGAGGHEQRAAENEHERKEQSGAEYDPIDMEADVGVDAPAETDGEPPRRHDSGGGRHDTPRRGRSARG